MIRCPKCGETWEPASKISPELEARWNSFWRAFPRKRGKAPALKLFKKLNPDAELFDEMMSALKIQSETCQEIKYFPYPLTWLSQKRWQDQVEEEKDSLELWAES